MTSQQPSTTFPSKRAALSWKWLAPAGMFLFWTLAFGIAFTQWPLYSENQNTKFLHGLAAAGYGYLGEDWLANTLDPLPAFSLLVRLTYAWLHEDFFYLYHALLLGVYIFSVLGIASQVFPLGKTRAGRVIFLVLVIAMHASLLPPFSAPVLGTSLGWLLQAGVANQYLFNPVFQPSTFGVLLVLSIYLFLRGRPYLAALLAALAAVFHSTYLPAAAVLTLAYVSMTFYQRRRAGGSPLAAARPALLTGLLSLAAVLPVLLYNAIAFAPTSAEAWARSQDIIVNFRIPHHSLPEIWIDNTTYVKVGIVLLALVLVRRSRLFPIMLLALVTAILGTVGEMLTGNDTLAFVAPWRISVFLVPLSSSMIFAFIVAALFDRLQPRLSRYEAVIIALSLAALLLLVVRGGQAMRDSFQARRASDRVPLAQFVNSSKARGEIYLTPTYMAEFRLETGAPQFVTFKSHPYKDVEVIEWQERVLAANDFYSQPSCEKLAGLAARYGITHAVLEASQLEEGCPGTQEVHRDGRYHVLRLATLR